jgi:hypothetical protein
MDLHRRELMGAFMRVDARLATFEDKAAREVVGTRDAADGRSRLRPLVEELRAELFAGGDVPDEEPEE